MFKNINVLLFDLDGTLVNSAPDLQLAVNATMREIGKVEYPIEDISQWIGNGSKLLLQRALCGKFDVVLDEKIVAPVLPRFLKHYADNLCGASQLYDGVFPTLQRLQRAGIKMACVTNKPIEFTLPVLSGFELDQFMPVVIGGGSVEELKPSAMPLVAACQQLGLSEPELPESVLMIGDSSSDIKAANAAGMASIAVDYGYSQGVDLVALGAQHQVSSLSELLQLLGIEN